MYVCSSGDDATRFLPRRSNIVLLILKLCTHLKVDAAIVMADEAEGRSYYHQQFRGTSATLARCWLYTCKFGSKTMVIRGKFRSFLYSTTTGILFLDMDGRDGLPAAPYPSTTSRARRFAVASTIISSLHPVSFSLAVVPSLGGRLPPLRPNHPFGVVAVELADVQGSLIPSTGPSKQQYGLFQSCFST